MRVGAAERARDLVERRCRTASSACAPGLVAADLDADRRDVARRRDAQVAAAEGRVGGEARRSRAIAARTGGERTSPTTAISAGSALACGKSRASASKPCLDSSRSGSVLTPLAPRLRPSVGTAGAISSAPKVTR